MHPTADAPQSPRAWGELTIGVRRGQCLSHVDSQNQWCGSLCRAINTPPSGVKTWATPPPGGAGLVDSAVCRESSDRRPFKRAECPAGSGHQTIQTVKKEAGILSTALKYFTRPSTHLRDLRWASSRTVSLIAAGAFPAAHLWRPRVHPQRLALPLVPPNHLAPFPSTLNDSSVKGSL